MQTYQYDSLYRLTNANEKAGSTENWKQDFTYDRYGNRLTHDKFINGNPITHNNQTHPTIDPNTNRFNAGQNYGYDKVGNLITDAEGRTFTFDGNNKQRFITDGNNATVGEYFYDGNGMRVKKHVYTGGVHTKTVIFVYSGGKLVEEYSSEAPPTEKKIKYMTEDHLGTPRIITDGNGEVVSRRDFMPFGEDLGSTVGTRSTSSFKYASQDDDVRQKFTGYQKDEETQLDFAEARMYENRHARFTAVDPLLASGNSANPQTFNRFIYVLNNPIAWIDPSGLCPTKKEDGTIVPCPENYDGVVYTKIVNGDKKFNDVQEDKSWTVFIGKATTTNNGVSTEVVGAYFGGVYSGGWYLKSNDEIDIDASEERLTDVDVFLRDFSRLGKPALPILEIIQPTPLPFFSVAAGFFKLGRASQKTYSVSKTIAAVEKVTEASKAAADAAKLLPKSVTGRTAGALLTTKNTLYFGGSVVTKKFKTILHPKLKKLLDKIPNFKRGKGHPNCTEPQCITGALIKGENIKGGLINTRLVRGKEHGKIIPPCSSCEILLEKLKIISIP